MLRVTVRSAWLPKAGNALEEYEDAYYPHYQGARSGARMSFAIADGASEGMLSRQWADILVRAFCRQPETDSLLTELLARSYGAWASWMAYYLDVRERQNRPIQWYEEPGLERGAFATLLGLVLVHEADASRWEAVALGDSCLFQVRDDQVIAAFPVSAAADFDSRPFLIASNRAHNERLPDYVRHMTHACQRGDRLLLMTDALAQWFLRAVEAGDAPWADLHADMLANRRAFTQWIQALRAGHEIRNDDVTLVALDIS